MNTQIIEMVKRQMEAQIKKLPKTTEELPIPRDVLVRDKETQKWKKRELLSDLSEFNVQFPFICRDDEEPEVTESFMYMKELSNEITKTEAEVMLSYFTGVETKIK